MRTIHEHIGPSPQGLSRRVRPYGPRHLPLRVRTDLHWTARHILIQVGHTQACLRCGRTTGTSRQGRLQQWRRPCNPIPLHRRRLEQGHCLYWDGKWHCQYCTTAPHRLTHTRCRYQHPTGHIRYTTKQKPNPQRGDRREGSHNMDLHGNGPQTHPGRDAQRYRRGTPDDSEADRCRRRIRTRSIPGTDRPRVKKLMQTGITHRSSGMEERYSTANQQHRRGHRTVKKTADTGRSG